MVMDSIENRIYLEKAGILLIKSIPAFLLGAWTTVPNSIVI